MERAHAHDVERVQHGSSDDPDVLDLSANINPRTPDGLLGVYRDAFEDARRYPAEPPTAYRETAAEYVDCNGTQVVPTPGGLAAIRLAIDLAVGPDDSVLVPAPSFSSYAREVRLQDAEPTFLPQDEILTADPADHALAIVCNPNNPTGTLYARDDLLAFAKRCREAETHLLVDEAFLGFTEQTSLAGTPGVTVARSLTKLFGLPGIRAGFAVATGEVREAMVAARRPWNVSVPALATGRYCMRQSGFVAETRRRIREQRDRLRDGLNDRFDVRPSSAPFLLVEVGEPGVDAVLSTAREYDVAIRDARTFRGLANHVRIAVRDRTATDRTLEVFADV
ncbi:aminotransferase class I/II-fold pyridoxal phosphate-dependent enzyme [Halorhabdus sp. CUG00001]|uniref:aminotransferase class I/II-fold pyridoxal phosphate-dependent enzyme n=1 Tax=Halorhabdus sp. CUG00001 TaxID=2600297 RepID=UPI00131B2C2B|nr:aminotransferase class I/II-fold pyridoxal phosphate-dependent enzyme [Halorhabdus sp. CUG00001]